MISVLIDKPHKLVIADRPIRALGRDQVLLKTAYVGLCGSDLNSFLGENPLVKYPVIPGHELAATVMEVGADVPRHITTNMAVTINPYSNCGRCASCKRRRVNACKFNETMGVQRDGCMSEFVIVPWQKLIYDEHLGLDKLVLVEPLSVGFHAVSRADITDAETVMVIGCGMIGLGAIIGSINRGAKVIVVDIDQNKLNTALQLGAFAVINVNDENVHEKVRDFTNGLGPDVVIEAVGNAMTYRMAIDEVAFTGKVVYIGYAKQDISFKTALFVQKEIDILGARNALLEDFTSAISYLKMEHDQVTKLVTRIVPPSEIGDAFLKWRRNTKILVKF